MEGTTEMTLYIKVTKDRYELPVAVAETKAELARMLGIKREHVRTAFSHAKKFKNPTYVVVEVDDND